jgi:3-hydroxypropanoate dehydrogenase
LTTLTAAKPVTKRLSEDAVDLLFHKARTHNGWRDKAVPKAILQELYDLVRMGPTSANTSPARFIFLTTPEAKARLLSAMSPANVDKTKAAPVTAIIAWDTEFHDHLPRLFPHADFRSYFVGNDALIHETAFRNSSLQGGYFILAARALGLDVGPMSGFDAEKVNAEFFPDGKWKVNFIANLGYGDDSKLFPRSPRLEFHEAALML